MADFILFLMFNWFNINICNVELQIKIDDIVWDYWRKGCKGNFKCLTLKISQLFLISKNCAITFAKKQQMKINKNMNI